MAYPQSVFAFELLDRAEEFLTTYYNAPPTEPPDWSRYSLLSKAVELALKAYIALHRGFTQDEQLEGMDLEAPLAEATSLGLPINPLTRSEIEKLNEAHTKARYPDEAATSVFVIKPFEQHVEELFKAVRQKIQGP